MGKRGEGWVVLQFLLFAGYVGAPMLFPFQWHSRPLVLWAGVILLIVSAVLLALSIIQLGHSLTPFPKPTPDSKLVTTGVYSLVRHPIYFALIVGALAIALISESAARLAWCGLIFVFFDLKSRKEERWLDERYATYGAYQVHVKKLIPWIY